MNDKWNKGFYDELKHLGFSKFHQSVVLRPDINFITAKKRYALSTSRRR